MMVPIATIVWYQLHHYTWSQYSTKATFGIPHLPLLHTVPTRTTMARALMPRQPYSEAVLSTGGRLHPLSSGKREAW